MYLLYINELGQDYKGQRQYEFIFGNDPDTLVEEWFIIPSAGRAIPPEVESIDLVGLLKNSDLKLELVQNSDYFGVIDAVDGIIALGWEAFDIEAEERPIRISFHFAEELESVTQKLATKGLRLINEEIKYKLMGEIYKDDDLNEIQQISLKNMANVFSSNNCNSVLFKAMFLSEFILPLFSYPIPLTLYTVLPIFSCCTVISFLVSVPVLSNATAVTRYAFSSAAPPFKIMPNFAALPIPTTSAVGVARPIAHGHEITKTAIILVNAGRS